ncbi:MAG: flagellar hook-associated protein FlgK [Parvularculaceae bacterium]
MSISRALANATSGIGAASRQAGLVSQNIANALTPGYARREIALAERTVAGQGAGVRVADVVRASTPALTAERRIADGAAARDEARLEASRKISALFGGPEDAGALFTRFVAFDRSLRDLANQPANVAALQRAAGDAQQLVLRVNEIARSLQTIRQEADESIAAEVVRVNASLKKVERLNSEIEKAVVSGRDASSLYDERDRELDVINRALPSRTLIRDNGRIDLITLEGAVLIAGEARQLSFRQTPFIDAGQSLANGALSGLFIDGVDITPGAGAARSVASGSIAGRFSVRDVIATAAAADLDALAADLIARFEAPGVDPTAPAGAAGLLTDGGDALTTPIAPGLAARLKVNAAVDPRRGGDITRLRDGLYGAGPGPSGSNTFLINLIGALDSPRSAPLPGGALQTASELTANVSALRASAYSEFQREAASSDAFLKTLAEEELSTIAVDTDAELQQLLIIEQSYAANARVIEVVGRLIERLAEL